MFFIHFAVTLLLPCAITIPIDLKEHDLEKENVMEELISEDNEVDIISQEEKFESTDEFRRGLPTRYFDFLDIGYEMRKPELNHREVVQFQYKKIRNHSATRNRIYFAWMPDRITDHSEGSNESNVTISFKQELPRQKYGDFVIAQIVVTRRSTTSPLNLNNNTFVRMRASWKTKNSQLQHLEEFSLIRRTQRISPNKSFYSFNITELLNSGLMDTLTQANYVNITFQVYNTENNQENMMNFKDLFDTEVERPAIILFFMDYVPTEMDYEKNKRRRKRSATVREGMCQRMEFSASPESLSWYDVVHPAKIDLGYCSGQCPFPLEDQSYNFTLHTFLLDRYRHSQGHDLPWGFPKATCVPVEYEPLHIFERVSGTTLLLKERIDDISVARCGCR